MNSLRRYIGIFFIASLISCGGSGEQITQEPVVEDLPVETAPTEPTGPQLITCSDFESIDALNPHAEAVTESLKKQAAITWDASLDVNDEEGSCAAVNISWGSGEEFDYSGYVLENSYEFQKRLPWILGLLDQVIPETEIRITKAQATAQNDTGYLFEVETSLTDGEIIPGKNRTVKSDLRLAITKLEEHSLAPEIPVESATVCMDIRALAIELDLDNTNLTQPIKLRTTRETLDSINIPNYEHIRRGSVTLMSAKGRIIQSRDFSHPGVVATKNGSCGCDLLISVAPGIFQQKASHTFDVMPNKDAEKVKWIQAQLSRPGNPLDMIADIRDIPSDDTPSDKYAAVLHSIFQQQINVAYTNPTQGGIDIRLEGAAGKPNRAKLAKQLSAIEKINNGDIAEKVCLQDQAGTTLAAFNLNEEGAQYFANSLQGLDALKRVVVLDAGSAGLAKKDSDFIVVDADDNTMRSLTELLKKRSTLLMKANLLRNPAEDREPMVNLPASPVTDRVLLGRDGQLRVAKEVLRGTAEIGSNLAIRLDDKVRFEGHGYTFEIPLLSFLNPQDAIRALTTRWGDLRTIKMPLRAFNIVNTPVDVEYTPGHKNLRVIAQDEAGRAITEASSSISFPLKAHRPLLKECSLVLQSSEVPPETSLSFQELYPWEIRAAKKYSVVNADEQSVNYHFVKSAGCAPSASKGQAHTLMVSKAGIAPLRCH